VAQRAERRVHVGGDMAVHLADEAQGDVELLLILPARARHSLHQVEQQVGDRLGRADGDEQAVHGGRLQQAIPIGDGLIGIGTAPP
jgi:hypothetical protein